MKTETKTMCSETKKVEYLPESNIPGRVDKILTAIEHLKKFDLMSNANTFFYLLIDELFSKGSSLYYENTNIEFEIEQSSDPYYSLFVIKHNQLSSCIPIPLLKGNHLQNLLNLPLIKRVPKREHEREKEDNIELIDSSLIGEVKSYLCQYPFDLIECQHYPVSSLLLEKVILESEKYSSDIGDARKIDVRIQKIEKRISTLENILIKKRKPEFIQEVLMLMEGIGIVEEDYYADERYYSTLPGIKNIRFSRYPNKIKVKVLSPIGYLIPEIINIRGEDYTIDFTESKRYRRSIDY